MTTGNGMGRTSRQLRRTLLRYYRRLYRHFGPQHWWPGRTRFEVILGALLTQNTSWSNVERALANLRRRGLLSPEKLAAVKPQQLTRLLRPAGYFRQKSRYVRQFLRHLNASNGGSVARLLHGPTEKLRTGLLTLPGVGPETADSILLYAGKRPVFVIDAYTRRVLARHGFASENASYDDLQSFFHRNLSKTPSHRSQDPVVDPEKSYRRERAHLSRAQSRERVEGRDARLFNEYHAQLVAVGKTYCHNRHPDCAACPLGPELERAHARA